jgi:hypothetical protein
MTSLQIDAPELLRPVGTKAEWDAVHAATSKRHGCARGCHLEEDVLAGDLLLLQPQETLLVPFALQVYKSSEGLGLASAFDAPQQGTLSPGEASEGSPLDTARVIHVRLLNQTSGETVRASSCPCILFSHAPCLPSGCQFHVLCRVRLLNGSA